MNRRWSVRVPVVLVGLVVALSLVAGSGVVGTAQAAEAPVCDAVTIEGSGTEADPHRVSTVDQLQCIGEAPGTSLGFADYYELTTNIDASETATWNDGAGFDPIGSSDDFFYGTFDGNGFVISNLHIDRPDTERVGLFARLFDLRIGNVSLESATITGGEETGGLVGYNEGGTVHNASVDGTVSGGGDTGGLVGANTGEVTNSSAAASVDGDDATGGLVGYNFDTVRNSSAAGSVNGSGQVGGLVGYSRGDVYTSSATGDVDGSDRVGGLVGRLDGTVTESHASGDATGSGIFVGGLIGINNGGDVSESYATGSVTGESRVGGFVGSNTGEITDAFAAGAIDTDRDVLIGGFAGDNDDGTITNAYWDSDRGYSSEGVGNDVGGSGPGDVTELFSTTDMQGSTAETELSDLFDSGSWTTVAGDYPDLVANPRTLSTRHYDYPSPTEMGTIIDDMETDGDGALIVTSDKALAAITTGLAGDYRLGLDIDASGTPGWNSGTGWYPLGFGGDQFSGSFDGDGHMIDGLYIDRAANNVGLFGSVTGDSTIEGVGVESVDVSGDLQIGGLVGQNEGGTVRDSYATGTVSGDDLVGGLIGEYLVATGDPGGVNESYAAVNVTGDVFVGGLIGSRGSAGTMNGSYATGDVDGTRGVGGLIGKNGKGAIRQSYATGDVTGLGGNGGGLGSNNFGGLIGVMSEATVENSFATGDVDGSGEFTGGLVGMVRRIGSQDPSTVRNSYATGDISASDDFTGGLVGKHVGSNLTATYATGSVDGVEFAGGLVGQNDGGTVNSSYAIGTVDGTDNVGGVVGNNTGTVESVYWDTETTGQTESNGSAARYGLPTERMTGLNATVGLFEFDFETTWQPATTASGYPVLAGDSEFAGSTDAYAGLVDGDGSAADPFEVSTVYELQLVTERLGEGDSFELVDDINASVTAEWYDEGSGPQGFEPLGNTTVGFNGTFDGGEYTITNLTINRSSDNSIGLFGHLESNGTVRSVTVDAATVSGNDNVGGLVGTNEGEVNGSSVAGQVDGSQRVGGLVGRNNETVRQSVAFAGVNGTDQTGGAVGHNDGTVMMVAATGTVDGADDVGGLVGRNLADGAVRQSYATGAVVDGTDVGGLVGDNDGGTVTNTYAAGAVNGTNAGGLVGRNEGGEIGQSYAVGRVNATSTDVGGLLGNNSADATIEDSYWDNGTTNQSTGVNGTAGTVTDLVGFGTRGHSTPASEMQGTAADDTMDALDFTTTWAATDDYPLLAWAVDEVDLTLGTGSLRAGQSTDASVTVTVADTTTRTATTTSAYSSNDTSVATIGGAVARGTGRGTALLSAEVGDVVGSTPLSVAAAPKTGGGGGGGGGSPPAPETTVTVDEATEDSAESTDSEGEESGSVDESDASRPDTRVSVVGPQPGQTLVIEGTNAYIVDGTAEAENAATDGTGSANDGDTAGDSGSTGDDSSTGSNVRSDRLSVSINTDRDFELSVTTYETDLGRSNSRTAQPSVNPFTSGLALLQPGGATPQVSAPDTVQAAAGSFESETNTVSAGYVDINTTLSPEEIGGATFEFSIRQAYLDELGVDAEEVVLYHRLDGQWVTRETTLISSDETHYQFEGTMPEFSVFALGTGAPPVSVTEASLGASTIETGETATVSATVANRGQADAEETIELTVDGEVVSSETVSLAGGETVDLSFEYAPTATGEYALAVGGVDAGSLTVGETAETGSTPWWLLIVLLVAIALLGVLWRRRNS